MSDDPAELLYELRAKDEPSLRCPFDKREPFIKDIPFTKHRDVYQWITRKLNQPRW